MHWKTPTCILSTLLASLAASESVITAIGTAANPNRYGPGQAIPVSCIDRNITTGEHNVDNDGKLVYVPFPACRETGQPLYLGFGVEQEFNCTIEITDPLFHLLEFYVHNDAPMTCRVPARPISPQQDATHLPSEVGILGAEDAHYIPLIVALTGTLQNSHIHVSNNLNMLIHAAPKHRDPGVIDSATAYSISHLTKNTKIIIGAALPLRLSVRWYPSTTLPSGWAGVGGHLFLSTLLYCILSAGAATAICVAYYRGVALPKRLRSHGFERAFVSERTRQYNGYGYGVGNGYGYAGAPGKVE